MNEIIALVLLACIQGFTEFLPVSSSGHLALTQYFIGWPNNNPLFFDVLLHFGTFLSTLYFFRKKLVELLKEFFIFIKKPSLFFSEKDGYILSGIIIATIPTGIIGLALKSLVENMVSSVWLLAPSFLITGIFLIISEKFSSKKSSYKTNISLADSLFVGIVQGIAAIPGVSRSGSTIAYLLLRGYKPSIAFLFSFLISLPAVFGANLLEIRHAFSDNLFKPIYLIGIIISFITGVLALKILRMSIDRKKLGFFGYYLLAIGIFITYIFIIKQK